MHKTNPKVEAGTVLIAQPFMPDSYFRRGVVVICEHRLDGSIGFILNKTVEMNICVATDTIHYIHNVGAILDGSTEIARGVYWGGDFDKLKFLVKSELVKPHNIRFFVGYSGWSEGQLDEELASGSWLVDSMDANYAFKHNKGDLWQTVLNNKGEIYTVIAQMDEFQALN